MPSPYVVNLVGSEIRAEGNGAHAVNKATGPQVPDTAPKGEIRRFTHERAEKTDQE